MHGTFSFSKSESSGYIALKSNFCEAVTNRYVKGQSYTKLLYISLVIHDIWCGDLDFSLDLLHGVLQQ